MRRTLRLCYISNPHSIHTQRWLHYFVGRGHDVHLIGLSAKHGSVPQAKIPSGVIFYDLMAHGNVRKLRYLVWGLAARRIVRTIRPDILHAHQVAGLGWVGAVAGYHPFVVTAWGSDLLVGPRRFWTQRQLARWVLRRADYVTCVSESLAQAARALGADPHRLEVAPWGIDTDIFHPGSDRDDLRAQLGLGPGPIVLSLRAMQSIYNPLDIAKAIPHVLKRVPTACFIIRTYNCNPDQLSRFRDIVEKYQVTNAVKYIGDLADEHSIADLYRVADVAVSVPSSDGAPSSVLEALACGATLVLSDLMSLREWITHEQEGLYVPVGNPEAIGAAIIRLLTDQSLRSRLRLGGIGLIRHRADAKVLMRQSEEIYQRIIEGS